MVPVDALTGTISLRRPGDTLPDARPLDPPNLLPPPEPPPTSCNTPAASTCPPGCLLDALLRPRSPNSVAVDLRVDTVPAHPSPTDSVTHVVCSPRVCGVHSDQLSSISLHNTGRTTPHLVDGGSNVCVTGDLGSLLYVVDIPPLTILVAIEGAPASHDDCITKRGLLPLTLLDGTTYYQTCF